MRGDFLRGLSKGILGELNRQRQDQQARDDDMKLQTIQTLAGLADRIEPEGLPMLLGHIWDTMGIKRQAGGKGLRGFLDAFSGMPNRSVEDQLGTKLKEITSRMIGPETATRARAGGDMARLFQPTTPEQEANRASRLQAESDLANKIIFRDPRREKLDELEKTYGLKFAQQESLLQQREELIRSRQAEDDRRNFENAWKLRQQAEDLRAERSVNARAYVIARRSGFKVPNADHVTQAAEQIASERGLNVGLLKARIGLTEARTDQAEAQTKVAQVRAGRLAAGISGAGNKGAKSAQMQKAVELFERNKQALIDATARGDVTMITALRKRLNQMATNLASKYGDRLEVGGGEWPYQKPRTSQGPVGLTPGFALPPTVETLPGGIRLTTPGPALNPRQRAIFDDIRREQPNAPDAQIFDYMRKKGWLQ
jgi:carbon monoxide dehydrogenase subunit G